MQNGFLNDIAKRALVSCRIATTCFVKFSKSLPLSCNQQFRDFFQ